MVAGYVYVRLHVTMASSRPFIPRDKPRSWVIGICAGPIGLGVGLIGFIASFLGRPLVKEIAVLVFVLCWVTFGLSWLFMLSGTLAGRYRNLEPRSCKEQQW